MTTTLRRGNTPNLVQRFYLVDPLTEAQTPRNPTTVTFVVQDPDGDEQTFVSGVDAEVTNPEVGVFVCAVPGPLEPGHYHWTATGTGNGVEAQDEDDFLILESSVEDSIDSPVAVAGPCTPWIDGDDVADCGDTNVGSDLFHLDDAAAMASMLLYELSGRQYPGICTRTVRPCRSDCSCFGLRPSLGAGVWAWAPWGAGYAWSHDCGDRCGCGHLPEITLAGYPVREILEVKIDGAVVSAATYRLDRRRDLVRVSTPADRLSWPACQDMSLADTEAGTFSVRYQWGVEAPTLGQRAAAQLGFELYRGCNGGECALPSKVTRIVRQGVTMEVIRPLAKMLRDGATGLNLVDAFLAYSNPTGMRRRPAVAQLDRPGYPRGR